MPSKLVFQRPFARFLALTFCVALAAGAALVAVNGLGAPIIRRVIIAGGALFSLVYLVPAAWRQMRSPRATLRIDHEGLEGNFGLLRWNDVDEAVIGHRHGRRPSVVRTVRFELKSGAPPLRPPSTEYAPASITGKPLVTATAIVLPLWSSRRAVAEDLQQYAPGLLR
jgi:hypothetical protein